MRAARDGPSRTSVVVATIVATALGACAPLAQVRETKPRLTAIHGTPAEQAIAEGEKLQRTDPTRAVGWYVHGVQLATIELGKKTNSQIAIDDYNFALARVFSVIHEARLDPWTHPLRLAAPNGRAYVLTYRPNAKPLWKPQDFDFIPADQLDVRGKLVRQRVTRPGIGASLVASRKPQAPAIRHPLLPPRIYAAVTAVAHFRERRCELEFIDPLANETAAVAAHTLPAEADFTAPLAVGLAQQRPEKFGVPAMLNPDKFADKGGLIEIQPHDPRKTPVILVHGLQDTPVTWASMVNAFWADPVIRRNYQVWVFAYPSGYPVPYSALLLRRQLKLVDKTYPNHRRIILVGHSMGGILSRLMISDSGGDKLWRYFFGKSPAGTQLSPESKALLQEALIFKPEPSVARVIFISTPHRGSQIASGPIGRLGSSLIHRPSRFSKVAAEFFHTSVVYEKDPGLLKLSRFPDSIDTLAPNDAFVKAMNTLPMAKGVPYHSIIGDRGRGDTPNSSDGVVPYWSSHLAGAESEKIVPSGHGAEHNPEGIAEVLRILHQHIGSRGSGEQVQSARRRSEIRYDFAAGQKKSYHSE